MREERVIEKTQFYATVSLRTLLLSVAAVALFLGLSATDVRDYGPFAPMVVFVAMMSLLALTCWLFASLADDVWRDPGVTIAAGFYGLLGYCFLIGMLLLC
ncbi:hypothetical protein Mal15_55220 [Stieleria maiorica]|uniref:Uncharacterized protein n=1 Tax=Stieleria maiorica TaxID=2795974 RepID=A0A5B9MP70_9BACT|nr:hypothetical protein [Stieleria maiorica]QEG01446.1 hypothetical protein Mal15_55220 [Stieleria maiorica]